MVADTHADVSGERSVSILLDCLTLNMEALGHSGTSVSTELTRGCDVTEDLNFHPTSSLM